jgi:hypothetical protein
MKVLILTLLFTSGVSPSYVELHWSRNQIVPSPTKKWSLVIGSADANDRAPISLQSKTKKIDLGYLQRDARASWSSDGRYLALNDLRYSNHFFLAVIDTEAKQPQIRNLDDQLKRAIRLTGELDRFEPLLIGWTPSNDVCASITSVVSQAGTVHTEVKGNAVLISLKPALNVRKVPEAELANCE